MRGLGRHRACPLNSSSRPPMRESGQAVRSDGAQITLACLGLDPPSPPRASGHSAARQSPPGKSGGWAMLAEADPFCCSAVSRQGSFIDEPRLLFQGNGLMAIWVTASSGMADFVVVVTEGPTRRNWEIK